MDDDRRWTDETGPNGAPGGTPAGSPSGVMDVGPLHPGVGGPGRSVVRPAGPITCGAELVVLAEAAQLRLFRLGGAFLLIGCVLAALFGSSSTDDPGFVTGLAALGGGLAALLVVARPLPSYLAFRSRRALRIVLATGAAIAVLAGGVDGPSWWVALGVVLLLSTVSSMAFAMVAAFVIAVAYVIGSLLAGGTLARDGIDAGIVAGAAGLPLYALVMRVVTEGFARVLLMLHRSTIADERGLPGAPPAPLRADGQPWTPSAGAAAPLDDVRGHPAARADDDARGRPTPFAPPAVVVSSAAEGPHDGPAFTVTGPEPGVGRGRSARMTVRQLEVALLARDGLQQAEIAEALAISVTQVERHLRQGRERAGAATVGELLGVLVEDGIIGPPVREVLAAAA